MAQPGSHTPSFPQRPTGSRGDLFRVEGATSGCDAKRPPGIGCHPRPILLSGRHCVLLWGLWSAVQRCLAWEEFSETAGSGVLWRRGHAGWGHAERGGASAVEATVRLCVTGGEKLRPGHPHVWEMQEHPFRAHAFSEAQWGLETEGPVEWQHLGWMLVTDPKCVHWV